ncbi:hypothetical protein MSAN_01537800 [Mycena sanguinolenta]|uniref:F-box domain-containing protein n=1 Tax=Mycena sanguinolenta TaxID=230812 RepID=A0A8H6Y7W1_9AGAR|nr:hypothetical protein MSAN_01537800 [Mycena sanguinolenta]
MSAALFLTDLAPDVIFSVFACCDISSVVSAGQTCRYLHDLALERSVWLGLLEDLRQRSILDRTLNLETLSTAGMIGIVRRGITGPQTWNPGQLDSEPVAEVCKEITLHPCSDPGNPAFPPSAYMAKLLPSGRYVLLTDWTTLECWNVVEDRLVWKHTSAVDSEHVRIVEFAAEETDIESAVIMICVRTHPPNGDRLNYVEMVRVDLQTGTHNSLLATRAPDSGFSNPFYHPVIFGALAAVKMINAGRDTYMIVNWRKRSHLILHVRPGTTLQILFIREHIMLMTCPLPRQEQIHLISNKMLESYWAPTIGVDRAAKFSPVFVEDIPKRCTFEHTDGQPFHKMYIHQNPLRDDDYRVWIRGTKYAANLSCYRLSILTHGQPQLRLQRRSVVSGAMVHPVSYSGHSLGYCRASGWTVVSPRSSKELGGAQLPFCKVEHADLAAYSGALIHSTRSTIVIQYYR